MSQDEESLGVSRPPGMDDQGVIQAIDAGARVIEFGLVISAGFHGVVTKQRVLVQPDESVARAGRSVTVLTALFGWWGFGLLVAPAYLWRNLRGGEDVTEVARAELVTEVAITQVAAADAAAELAAARGGPLDARRTLAMTLLDRGELETAWELIGRDVTDGPLRRDFAAVRKLLVVATGRRGQQARAGLLATILLQDHGDEVKGYLASIVEKAVHEADTPPDAHLQAPFLETPPGLILMFGTFAACVAFGVWATRR